MLKNYLAIAIRNLVKYKFFNFINIAGLTVGITCAILIGLYLRYELSYDKYNIDYDRIYRLESHFNIHGNDDKFAVTAFPLARALQLEYPQIESYTRFLSMDNNFFKHQEKNIFEENVYFADSTVFDIFSWKFISGSAGKSLAEPNTMVLTRSLASRIFGNEDPMGEVLDTGYGFGFTITGVIEDIPGNSHLNFSALCSMITLSNFYGVDNYNSLDSRFFWNVGFFSYIKLYENSEIQDIMEDFPRFYDKYMKALGDQFNASFQLMVQPLADVHLYSKVGHDLPRGNVAYIYIFGIVAIFLLVIASINYMNLATSQSAKRSLEVGIRKVVGAHRALLRSQFLTESILTAIISLIIALIAARLLLPVFNEIAGRSLTFNLIENKYFLLAMFGIAIIVGIISGSYPALYLSSFQPVAVIKGKEGKFNKALLRKLLVLVQFSISIIMIIGTITVAKQLDYLRTKDLGFDEENIVVLTVRDTTGVKNLDAFKEELLKHQNIMEVGRASSVPGAGYGIIVQKVETEDGSMVEKGINFVFVDNDYLDTMEMEVIQGRNFNPELQTDLEEAILINEAAARILGYGEEAIGKKIEFGVNPDGDPVRSTRVIGVVKDFHYASLHNPVDPILILLADSPLRNLSLRISGDNVAGTIDYIREKWTEFCPTFPFEYTFLEDNLNDLYIAEQKIAKVFTYFALVSIFIACLGLFGLAAYTANQRTKEIGIRKVMGANVTNISTLLAVEFTKWVLIANIIAWPVAYFALQKWLDNFAYQIDITKNIGIFIVSGCIAIAIAIITVSFQAIKAALANPIDALKYE